MSAEKTMFPVGEMIGRSWDIFKDNVGPLLGATLIFCVVCIGASAIPFVGVFVYLAVLGPLTLGYYKIVRSTIRGEGGEIGELFFGFKDFLPPFLAGLLIALFCSVGTLLCVIPGILAGIIYSLTYLVMLDGEKDFWQAMETSRKLVMANFGQWIILMLALIALNLVGALVCGVGMLVTGPMAAIVVVLAYDMERPETPVDVSAEPVEPAETE